MRPLEFDGRDCLVVESVCKMRSGEVEWNCEVAAVEGLLRYLGDFWLSCDKENDVHLHFREGNRTCDLLK